MLIFIYQFACIASMEGGLHMVNSTFHDIWPRFTGYVEGVYFFDIMSSSENANVVIGQIAFCPSTEHYTWIKRPKDVNSQEICEWLVNIIKSTRM